MTLATSALLFFIHGAPPALAPPAEPTADTGCWYAPLELRLVDYLRTGDIVERVRRRHCLRRGDQRLELPRRGPFVVGKTRFGRFTLFGQQLGYGLDVVVRPTREGDLMYATPALDLPEPWLLAIDKATYPVLVVGGAVVLTTVILQLAR